MSTSTSAPKGCPTRPAYARYPHSSSFKRSASKEESDNERDVNTRYPHSSQLKKSASLKSENSYKRSASKVEADLERGLSLKAVLPVAKKTEDGDTLGWRQWIFMTLDHPHWSQTAHVWGMFMTFLIIASCFNYMVGTCPQLSHQPHECAHPICVPGPDTFCHHVVCPPEENHYVEILEWTLAAIFSFDFLIRLVTVHSVPYKMIHFGKEVEERIREPGPWEKTFHYLIDPLSIIDMLAIMPFYVQMLYHHNEVYTLREDFHILRLLRLLRIFKLGRYSDGMVLLVKALRSSLAALGLLGGCIVLLTVTFGTLVYFAEHGEFKVTKEFPNGTFFRKDAFGVEDVSPFTSILVAAYWVVLTATTVGSQDVYPVTTMGRVISVIVCYSGIVTTALPVMIIGNYFSKQFTKSYSGDKGQAPLQLNRVPTFSMDDDSSLEEGGGNPSRNLSQNEKRLQEQFSKMEDAFMLVRKLMLEREGLKRADSGSRQ